MFKTLEGLKYGLIFVLGIFFGQLVAMHWVSSERHEELSQGHLGYAKSHGLSLNPAFPPMMVHQQLVEKSVGNYEFHYAKNEFLMAAKSVLGSVRPDLIVIVGFERGQEAYDFLGRDSSLKLIGFEAQKLWVDQWNDQKTNGVKERVKLVHAIVEEQAEGETELNISDVKQTAASISMDSVVDEKVLLLSVDIDGFEMSALKGSLGVLQDPKTSPLFLFVEISYSQDQVRARYAQKTFDKDFNNNVEILKFLDHNEYILFGICWWGTLRATKLHQIHNCQQLPATFDGYAAAVRHHIVNEGLEWAISNIIAIKRGALSDKQIYSLLEKYTSAIYDKKNRKMIVRIDEIIEREERVLQSIHKKDETTFTAWGHEELKLKEGISDDDAVEKIRKRFNESFHIGHRFRGRKGYNRMRMAECTWCDRAWDTHLKDNKYYCGIVSNLGVVNCP